MPILFVALKVAPPPAVKSVIINQSPLKTPAGIDIFATRPAENVPILI